MRKTSQKVEVKYIREGKEFIREGKEFIREGKEFIREGKEFIREGKEQVYEICDSENIIFSETEKVEKSKKDTQKIPKLDFGSLKKSNSLSTFETLMQRERTFSFRPKSEFPSSDSSEISDLLKTNRETFEVIEEIKEDLDFIKTTLSNDVNKDINIRDELKQIKKRISNIVTESPRTLSRCDAIVGNTQMVLSKISQIDSLIRDIHKKDLERYVSLSSMILLLSNDVSSLQKEIQTIQKNLNSESKLE